MMRVEEGYRLKKSSEINPGSYYVMSHLSGIEYDDGGRAFGDLTQAKKNGEIDYVRDLFTQNRVRYLFLGADIICVSKKKSH